MFNVVLLSLVQMDLDEPAAVQFHSDPLTDDLTGENQILQDGVVDRGQSTAGGNANKTHDVNTEHSKQSTDTKLKSWCLYNYS